MEVLHEINLARFWKLFKDKWYVFAIVWVLTAAFALMIGFSIPKTYESEMKLAPESSSGGLGQLSSITSMLGMNMNNLKDEDAILPTLYPDVVSSADFVLDLLKIKVSKKDGSVKNMSYDQYLAKCTKATWWDKAIEGLSEKIFKDKEDKVPVANSSKTPAGGKSGPIMLSRKQMDVVKYVQKAVVSCDVDKKTDVITIKAIDQDPLVAAIIVDSVSTRLQEFITDYRTKKARGEVAHLEQLFEKAKADYKKAQQDYAAYSDTHMDVMLDEYKVKIEALENDVQLKYNVYSQLMVQLQTAKAKVLERTPIYTTLEAPIVPDRHIAPKKVSILLVYLIVSTLICFLVVYYRERKKEKKSSILIESNGEVEEQDLNADSIDIDENFSTES